MEQNHTAPAGIIQKRSARDIRAGRYALGVIVVLTAVNLGLLLADRSRYFLFSASVPYYLTFLTLGIDNGFTPLQWSHIGFYTRGALGVSVVILGVYLLLLLLSRKRPGLLLGALILFALDTLALVCWALFLVGRPWINPTELFLHIWAIAELGKAVAAHRNIKKDAAPECLPQI